MKIFNLKRRDRKIKNNMLNELWEYAEIHLICGEDRTYLRLWIDEQLKQK